MKIGLSTGICPIPVTFTKSVALVPTHSNNFRALSALTSDYSFVRGSGASVFDSTGYLSYAPENLVLRSQALQNAAWLPVTSPTVTGNSTTAPDGTTTATLIGDTSSSVCDGVYQDITIANSTDRFVWTVYAKKSTTNVICMNVSIFGGTGVSGGIAVDLNNGNYNVCSSFTAAPDAASVTSVGSGWYKISIAVTNNASGNTTLRARVFPGYAAALSSATQSIVQTTPVDNTVTGTAYFWGAQLNRTTYSNLPCAYTATTSTAYYGPRFDYNPVGLAARGLLVEEGRTNILLHSGNLSNAAWLLSTVTVTSNSTTAPDGTTRAITATDSSAAAVGALYQDVTVANDSSTYSASIYLKKNTANVAAITVALFGGTQVNGAIAIDLNNGNYTWASSLAAAPLSATVTSVGNGWYRCCLTIANNASGNTTFRLRLSPAYATALATPVNLLTTSTAQDITLVTSCYAWGAQGEVVPAASSNQSCSSYISTGAVATARGAEIITNSSLTWYNTPQGTIKSSWELYGNNSGAASRGGAYQFDNGTSSQSIAVYGNYAGTSQVIVTTGGTGVVGLASSAVSAGITYGSAFGYQSNFYAGYLNNVSIGTDTNGTVPSGVNRLIIGSAASNYLNGWLRDFNYFPSRPSDQVLSKL